MSSQDNKSRVPWALLIVATLILLFLAFIAYAIYGFENMHDSM
jgi:hypothetical protein